jgi:hypothetical protein
MGTAGQYVRGRPPDVPKEEEEEPRVHLDEEHGSSRVRVDDARDEEDDDAEDAREDGSRRGAER